MTASGAAAAAAAAAATTPATVNHHPPHIPAPGWLFLFDHRSLFDVTDADFTEIAAWEEALGAFGAESISRETFMASMSQRSDSEVMMAMCPYTTRMEWPTVLNKKRVKITKEVKEWCYANAVPIPGVVDFLEQCNKEFAGPSSSGDDDNKQHAVLALWMTTWTVEQGQQALSIAGVKAVVAPTQVQDSGFAFFDTLEAFGLRPALETPEALQGLLRYRTHGASVMSKVGSSGDTVEAAAPGAVLTAAPPTEAAAAEFLARHKRLTPVRASTANERKHDGTASGEQSRVVYFTGSARNAKIAHMNGLVVIGVSYNSFDQESDESDSALPGCATEAELRAAGCRIVIRDFTKMRPEFLKMI